MNPTDEQKELRNTKICKEINIFCIHKFHCKKHLEKHLFLHTKNKINTIKAAYTYINIFKKTKQSIDKDVSSSTLKPLIRF